jgi:hypothetical protein
MLGKPVICPECGHNAAPKYKRPGGVLAGIAGLADPTGAINVARDIASLPFCANCGAEIKEAVSAADREQMRAAIEKAGSAAKGVAGRLSAAIRRRGNE